MLTQAKHGMIPALTRLWRSCFGDSEDYIAFFMVRRFVPGQTAVWLEEGEVVGAAYLLPCQIDETAALYGYAVAVAPEQQGRGICTAMLEALGKWCLAHKMPLLVAPRKGLEDYYHRRGYQDAFFCRWVEFGPGRATFGLAPREADPAAYAHLRDRALPRPGLVRWSAGAVGYALAEHRYCGGFAHILSWNGTDQLLLGRLEEDWLILSETTLTEAGLAELAPSLCAYYGAQGLRCRLPSGSDGELTGVCLGNTAAKAGWLGLELT